MGRTTEFRMARTAANPAAVDQYSDVPAGGSVMCGSSTAATKSIARKFDAH